MVGIHLNSANSLTFALEKKVMMESAAALGVGFQLEIVMRREMMFNFNFNIDRISYRHDFPRWEIIIFNCDCAVRHYYERVELLDFLFICQEHQRELNLLIGRDW